MKVKEAFLNREDALNALYDAVSTLNEVADYLRNGVREPEVKELSLDDLRSALIPIINESDGNGTRVQELLQKYGAAKISALPADKRQPFLNEVINECQTIPF